MLSCKTVEETAKEVYEFSVFVLRLVWIVVKGGALLVWPEKRKSLRGEVVLITGSAHGIGRQMALDASRMGAKVVLWDINKENAREVAEIITLEGGSATWYACDVTREDDVIKISQKVVAEIGEVTVLINNAGILQNLPILELLSEQITKTVAVNLVAHFWTIRAFLPSMLKMNRGHIVAVSSAGGLIGHINQTDYCASKHGVLGMMEGLAAELKFQASDIKLTTVCPLTVNTGLNQNPTTNCSWMMPIVTIEDASRQIIDAIRKEKFLVTIPGRIDWFLRFSRLLPKQVLSEILEFTNYCRVPNSSKSLLMNE